MFDAVVRNTFTTIDATVNAIVVFQVLSTLCQLLHQIMTAFTFQCFANLNKPVKTVRTI